MDKIRLQRFCLWVHTCKCRNRQGLSSDYSQRIDLPSVWATFEAAQTPLFEPLKEMKEFEVLVASGRHHLLSLKKSSLQKCGEEPLYICANEVIFQLETGTKITAWMTWCGGRSHILILQLQLLWSHFCTPQYLFKLLQIGLRKLVSILIFNMMLCLD